MAGRSVVLLALFLFFASKDIGNINWACEASGIEDVGETEDASHLAVDDNFFQDNNEESSGLGIGGLVADTPTIFGEGTTTDVQTKREGSGEEEITIPPAVTELITEGVPSVAAQLGTTKATSEPSTQEHTTVVSESTGHGAVSTEPPSDRSNTTQIKAEQTTETSKTTEAAATDEPSTITVTQMIDTSTPLPSSASSSVSSSAKPVTDKTSEVATTSIEVEVTDLGTAKEPSTTEAATTTITTEPETEPRITEAATKTITTDQPTAEPETEPSTTEAATTAKPTTNPRYETSTKPVTTVDHITDGNNGGIGEGNIGSTDFANNSADPCSRIFCKKGYMCVPTADRKSAECYCPRECSQTNSPCCSVYFEEYSNICEMHQQTCGLNLNIALRNKGKCSDSLSDSKYLPKIVAEEMDPSSNCLHEEVIQFAVRFQEWALINKELAESLDPAELNLNSAILQARLNGLTPFEKRQVLKHQFTALDINVDRHLDKNEVEALLRFVPSEHCLFGFMVSADIDRNGILNREEWYEAFQLQNSDGD